MSKKLGDRWDEAKKMQFESQEDLIDIANGIINKAIEATVKQRDDAQNKIETRQKIIIKYDMQVKDIIHKAESECKQKDARIAELEKALRKVYDLGHNNDCIFCGLKDKQISQALGEEE